MLGDTGGIAHAEMASSKLIVIWANNITLGHLHLIKIIRQTRKQGAKVVVIDPKRIRIAEDADLFLQIKPGSDLILAYAVANLIAQMGGLDKEFIDENISGADQFLEHAEQYTVELAAQKCGLSVDDIKCFAEYWCSLKPASLTIGVALERSRSGGSAIRGAMSLPLLTGNFLEKGAGICDPSSYFKIDRECLKRPDWSAPQTRTINILDIAAHIIDDDLDVPIKALFIYNHNPVAVHPRQGLLKQALDTENLFIVGYDLNMTDSMRYADIILPACSSMEYGDVYKAYGHTALQRTKAAIKPVGDSRANTRVFRELAEIFGFDDREFSETDEQMMRAAVANLPEEGELIDNAIESNIKNNVAFRDRAPNSPINKALRYNPEEQERAGLGLPRYK